MAQNPFHILEKMDLELVNLVKDSKMLAVTDGALPKKFKLLVAMALDAAHGSAAGVKSLTLQAIQAGATKEEVTETLRVALYVSGAGAVFTAVEAFEEIF